MTRWIVPNFGFEYEISGRAVPRGAADQRQRFAHVLRLIPGAEAAEPLGEPTADRDVLCWGLSAAARALAPVAAERWPLADAVARANDKRVSHAMERELGIALAGATVASTLDEAREGARRLGAWVAKHPFGVAGRDQVRGRSWDAAAARDVARLLATTPAIVMEPLVEIRREVSVHFDIGERIELVGVTELLTDGRGTFRGNRTGAAAPEGLREVAASAAERVRDLGYFGPLGIDGFEGTLQGDVVVREVSEINARWTFGRLALELARRLDADIVWHHPRRGEPRVATTETPTTARSGTWLLPAWCDPEGASGTWLEVR